MCSVKEIGNTREKDITLKKDRTLFLFCAR